MPILSIDPGYGRIGFAVLEKGMRKHSIIFSQCFETRKDSAFADRILIVGMQLEKIIKQYKPECVAMEQVFFSRNKKTALSVAEIRGCCSFVARKNGVPVHEYTPKQVKGAVTGNGSASKEEVMRMLPYFVDIDTTTKRKDDEYDAIAVGVTHFSASALQKITKTRQQ